jgi:hypothetical protein
LTDGITTNDWQYWSNNFTWDGMLVVGSSEFYGINPLDVYKTYIGTNKIIIDDEEGLVYQPEKLNVYAEVQNGQANCLLHLYSLIYLWLWNP